jgi:hypothetical protein
MRHYQTLPEDEKITLQMRLPLKTFRDAPEIGVTGVHFVKYRFYGCNWAIDAGIHKNYFVVSAVVDKLQGRFPHSEVKAIILVD